MNVRLINGSEGDEFPITIRVKQRCVLAPILFSSLFSMRLLSAYKDSDPGIKITYRTDECIFNAQCLKAKITVTKLLVRDIQRLADSLSTVIQHFGLTINTKNIEVFFQPAKGSRANILETKVVGRVFMYIDFVIIIIIIIIISFIIIIIVLIIDINDNDIEKLKSRFFTCPR